MNLEQLNSASKIVTIAHQQTLGLLLSDLSSDFYLYLEL
jgi:hypothetical protein